MRRSSEREIFPMRIALWIVTVLLGVMFAVTGLFKAVMPLDELAKNITWVPQVPGALVRFIGAAEFLGGVGLILPSVTRIKPQLTVLAGAGLVLVMILAMGFHVS